MQNSYSPDAEFLKTVLQPLFEDFQYWFDRSRTLLETQPIDFLTSEEQAQLLERVKQAQQMVDAAQLLFQATDGQVGIDISTLIPWHQLLTECWQVGMRFRVQQSKSTDLRKPDSSQNLRD